MLYAILAYHVEAEVMSWSPEEDAALMADLLRIHDRLTAEGRLGPAARLGPTGKARTLRGAGGGMVLDGPFAETKEQLGGFFVIEAKDMDEACAVAARFPPARVAVIEVRPVQELTHSRDRRGLPS
jgi:hypothetical protein